LFCYFINHRAACPDLLAKSFLWPAHLWPTPLKTKARPEWLRKLLASNGRLLAMLSEFHCAWGAGGEILQGLAGNSFGEG
jgi:hypothetical protein